MKLKETRFNRKKIEKNLSRSMTQELVCIIQVANKLAKKVLNIINHQKNGNETTIT